MIVAHTTASMSWPFDFILASRRGNDVEPDFVYHLSRFMRSKRDHQVSRDALITSVASNILLDAYSPKMHDKTILTLANMNAQHLIKICRLRFEDAL